MNPFNSLFVLYFPFFFFGKNNFTIINYLFSLKCICSMLQTGTTAHEGSFSSFVLTWSIFQLLLWDQGPSVAQFEGCPHLTAMNCGRQQELWAVGHRPEKSHLKRALVRGQNSGNQILVSPGEKKLNRQQNTHTTIQINHWIEILF